MARVRAKPLADLDRGTLARARRGDPEAFRALVDFYDGGLRALAYRLLGDRERMDDVLQEVYLKAYRELPKFRGASGLGTWLYRVTYNASIDELRRARRMVHIPIDSVSERGVGSADTIPDLVARDGALGAALAALPAQERAAVLLVDAQGFDYAAAGEVLGIPAGTVASRLNRARLALRASLAERSAGGELA